jgi:hypothetical protein
MVTLLTRDQHKERPVGALGDDQPTGLGLLFGPDAPGRRTSGVDSKLLGEHPAIAAPERDQTAAGGAAPPQPAGAAACPTLSATQAREVTTAHQ